MVVGTGVGWWLTRRDCRPGRSPTRGTTTTSRDGAPIAAVAVDGHAHRAAARCGSSHLSVCVNLLNHPPRLLMLLVAQNPSCGSNTSHASNMKPVCISICYFWLDVHRGPS